MKQMFVVGHGGPEKLQLRESPEPSPARGEIRIRVKVSGVNFADILARQGLYPDSPKVPCVVGYEVSGTVDTVGPGVDHAWVGKDVFALTRFGGYSDVVVVPEKQIFAKPASLSHELAAAIPVNYLTAWQLLVVMGSLKREETVLVHNVGDGVGLAAIDIAGHIGATIYGTASGGKHAFLLQRGLHEAIDYRTKDWAVELERLTNGKGVALITDPLGGNHWKKSYKALRSTGRLRYVWRFGGNYVEAVWAVTSAAGCARHAVIPSARADEHKQISLRRKPRAHVARDRHDRGLDGNTAEGRRGWLGPPPCGQELPARTGRRGTNLYRRA